MSDHQLHRDARLGVTISGPTVKAMFEHKNGEQPATLTITANGHAINVPVSELHVIQQAILEIEALQT